jgi:hypothetical protein
LNRWGEVVFNEIFSTGIQPSWDGFDNFGNACIDGTYYFVLKKEKRKKTGFIELVR